MEQEQEFQVNKLMKKIKKLENDTITKQLTLEQVTLGKLFTLLLSPQVNNYKTCNYREKKSTMLCSEAAQVQAVLQS